MEANRENATQKIVGFPFAFILQLRPSFSETDEAHPFLCLTKPQKREEETDHA